MFVCVCVWWWSQNEANAMTNSAFVRIIIVWAISIPLAFWRVHARAATPASQLASTQNANDDTLHSAIRTEFKLLVVK